MRAGRREGAISGARRQCQRERHSVEQQLQGESSAEELDGLAEDEDGRVPR